MIIYIVIVLILAAVTWYMKGPRTKKEIVSERLEISRIIAELDTCKTSVLQARAAGYDNSGEFLRIASSLETALREIKNDDIAAFGHIKRAEALRSELHYRPDNPDKQVIQYQINQAKQSYQAALDRAAGNASLTASAKFGMGICEEELGNFDAAKEIYLQIVNNSDFKGTLVLEQAKKRLSTIEDFKKQVVFSDKIPEPISIVSQDPNSTELTDTTDTTAEPNIPAE